MERGRRPALVFSNEMRIVDERYFCAATSSPDAQDNLELVREARRRSEAGLGLDEQDVKALAGGFRERDAGLERFVSKGRRDLFW